MEGLINKARLDAMIYHLISKLFKLPDISIKEEKVVEALSELLYLVNDKASDYAKRMIKDLNIDNLKLEYTRLFIGPNVLLAPPYGSLYLEDQGQLMGISTFDAMDFYSKVGLIKSKDFKEPPDHIRIELEFLQYLNSKAIDTYEQGELKEANNYLDLQDEFMKKHLGSWIRPFTKNIISNTESEFYKNLALLLQKIF